jgi:hypothetical protein
MTKNPPEAEVITQPEGFYYKEQYREYSRKTKNISTFAWTIGFLSLLFSFIPIFGLIFSIFAIIVALIKKTPVFIPIIAFIIASFVTTFVLMIAWLFSLLF